MYLAVPVLLYASERTLRLFRSGLYTVRLIKVSVGSETISGRLFKLVSTSLSILVHYLFCIQHNWLLWANCIYLNSSEWSSTSTK